MSGSLYDHYKDTCQTQHAACSLRNKFFLALPVLVFVLGAFTFDPQGCEKAAAAVLAGYGFNLSVSGRVMQTLLWVGVLYTYIRYLQLMTTIEREYLYLNKLEHELKRQGCPIDREGSDYSMGGPFFKGHRPTVQTIFHRTVLEIVLLTKAIAEGFTIDLFSIIDWAVFFLFTTLTVLYWIYLREVNKAYDKMGVKDEEL